MIGLQIRADVGPARQALGHVQGGLAMNRAINRTASAIRTRLGREVAADIGLPVREVTKLIVLEPSTPQRLRAFIVVTAGARIPLIDLKARGPEPSRGRGRGVSYVGRGGVRRQIASGFIATMRSGHRGVFRRVGAGARKSAGAWSKNLPIVELKGPSILRVASKRAILDPLHAFGLRTLLENVLHEIRFRLTRARGQ